MTSVFTAAVLVPSPPLLVPELTGNAAAETDPLRRAALTASADLASRSTEWVAVGAGSAELTVPAETCGTFRGFGVDVQVSLGPVAAGEADPDLPLAALIAGWLRTSTAPAASVDMRVLATSSSPQYCFDYGAELRTLLDRDDTPRGLMIVADGANTLTAKAPGSFDPRSVALQEEIDRALDSGDCETLTSLDPSTCEELGVTGRVAWQVLAGVFGGEPPSSCRALYAAAPYGVGYYVGEWLP